MRRGSFQSIELRRYVLKILCINKGNIAPPPYGVTKVLEPYYKQGYTSLVSFFLNHE
jgi:hypothetical protein